MRFNFKMMPTASKKNRNFNLKTNLNWKTFAMSQEENMEKH